MSFVFPYCSNECSNRAVVRFGTDIRDGTCDFPTLDLGSSPARGGGSSPPSRTNRYNNFSVRNGKKTQQNQHTELPKSAFRWLPDEQAYECPEGHRLHFTSTHKQQRTDHRITLSLYACPAEHCLACPRQQACTRTPQKGRTVSRMENEELLDALRARMQTDDAKRLYKRRSQTVELNYADMKEHRGLRRFHCRSPRRAGAEVGTLVLAHNLLWVAEQHRANRHGRNGA